MKQLLAVLLMCLYLFGATEGSEHAHCKTPVKTVDICCIAGHTVIPVSEISLQLPAYNLIKLSYANYSSGDYLLLHIGDIFQPPKA